MSWAETSFRGSTGGTSGVTASCVITGASELLTSGLVAQPHKTTKEHNNTGSFIDSIKWSILNY
jgi:hypothetical protein